MVGRGALHGPVERIVQARDEGRAIFGDEVAEPLGLDEQPQPLDRIEVGRIGRQEQRLEFAPAVLFAFVPARVVADQDIAPPLGGRMLVG